MRSIDWAKILYSLCEFVVAGGGDDDDDDEASEEGAGPIGFVGDVLGKLDFFIN